MTTNAVAQGCNLLAPPGGGPLYSLYFANGVPFSFPVAFNLLPGSEIDVFAYTDRMFAGCAGIPLEVIDIRVTALPAASADDRNGNLLL
ncbi:MAG: hypothetical protein O3A51_06770, partial [Verrucomicrobia bacterium]|nr:hypothetical protein [Verrucomicrobiota bacterium]